jgi:hypothetical protein
MLPLVIRVDDSESRTSTVHAFDASPVRVGRNPLNDLVLDNDAISQFHAEIDFDEHDTRFVDLGSTNGSSLAGAVLTPQAPASVPPRGAVAIGPLNLVLDRTQPPALLAASKPKSFAGQLDDGTPMRGTRVFSRSRAAQSPIAPAAIAPASHAHAQATVMNAPASDSARYAATVYGGAHASSPSATAEPVAAAQTARANEMRPAYEAYRRAWDAVEAAIARALETVPPDEAAATIAAMDRQMDALAQEPRFRALAFARGVALTSRAAAPGHAFDRVGQIAERFGIARPSAAGEIDELLVRLVRALETFAEALLALQASHDAASRELRRRGSPPASSRLGGASDPLGVVMYVLDPSAPMELRLDEVRRAFADVLSRDSAALRGVVRGVRGILARLAPEAVDREMVRAGGAGFWGFVRAVRESALWRRYVAQYRSVAASDDEIRAAVFGERR